MKKKKQKSQSVDNNAWMTLGIALFLVGGILFITGIAAHQTDEAKAESVEGLKEVEDRSEMKEQLEANDKKIIRIMQVLVQHKETIESMQEQITNSNEIISHNATVYNEYKDEANEEMANIEYTVKNMKKT
ncbi:MAG: hypothetical protein LBF08_06400 [Dysgonamonadaceae bacterium]|jgi:hypothetical protein|nr:hypothetical protein [Dysgonamonadaceae bacterium]